MPITSKLAFACALSWSVTSGDMAFATGQSSDPPPSRETSTPASSKKTLTLFGLPLHGVGRKKLDEILRQRGALPVRGTRTTNPNADKYDVKPLKLPGVHTLEVQYYQDQFLAATYSLGRRGGGAEEKLRKMLLKKYGVPLGGSVGKRPRNFGEPYVDGRYHWDFDDRMRVTFNRPFIGNGTLAYVDLKLFEKVKAVVKKADEADTKRRADDDAF